MLSLEGVAGKSIDHWGIRIAECGIFCPDNGVNEMAKSEDKG
jgi:hypothetical protein